MKKLKYIAAIIAVILVIVIPAKAKIRVEYTQLEVPPINSSFKSFEDYGCINDKSSPNYQYLNKWCWIDYDGFVRCDAEKDLGITADYYAVAMGSYYGTEIGTKYRITTNTGNVFYCVMCDQKDNRDTDITHRYGIYNNDVIEFVVNSYLYRINESGTENKQYLFNSENIYLNSTIKQIGSANVYMPLNGSILQVEKITFIQED